MKNTERFSNRAKSYSLYRPHYPAEILSFLETNTGFDQRKIVADIGSGTGISAELFVKNSNQVYGIEPNKQMREIAEENFKNNPNFISVIGTAESIPLPDSSVDFIVVGQAIHWFNKPLAKKEFQRIIVPNGFLLILSNDRDLQSPLQQEYENLLLTFAPEYENLHRLYINFDSLKQFFWPFSVYKKSFPQKQIFDFSGLKGRADSMSFSPLENEAAYQPMLKNLEELFNRYSKNGKIEFPYQCNLYFGKIS